MKYSFKKSVLAVTASMMMSVSAWAASPADTYQQAVNTMIHHPQGTYTMQVQADMPVIGTGTCTTKVDVQEKPFVSKIEVSAAALGKASPTVHGYAEQEGKKIVYYYDGQYAKLDDKRTDTTVWVKHSIDLKRAEPVIQQLASPHHVLAGVKEVTAKGNVYTVTYDMTKLYTPGDEIQWKKQGASEKDIEMIKGILRALQQAGDIKADVTIDSQSNRIMKVDIPLTSQVRSALEAALKHGSPAWKDKDELLQFIALSDVSLSITWAELPQGIELSVPSDVKKMAKEYK